MTDIERVKKLLEEGASLAVVNGTRQKTMSSCKVEGLLSLAKEDDILSGGCAADKVVGKAAALIMAGSGVKEVYAAVISAGGKAVLEKYGIKYTFGRETDYIKNRDGSGMCPMEQAVMCLDEPEEAIGALERTVSALKAFCKGEIR